MDYSGKVVVIIGAGSGMGKAMVKAFAEAGASVAALGRTNDKLQESIGQVDGGIAPTAYQVDIGDPEMVSKGVAEILADKGRIDLLCNNAGLLDSYKPAHEVDLEEWHNVMRTNLTGPFLMARAVLPTMLAQGKGGIINTASISSFSAACGGVAYTASKHGVLGLSRQLAFEYGALGIRVNAICPGATATPMTMPQNTTDLAPDWHAAVARVPAKRWCQPEEIAKLAVFLGSDDADYVHGSAFVIDGGWLTAAREVF